MNRLTFNENGSMGVVGMNEENQDIKLYCCVERLIEYEDTGLSPNEIVELKQQFVEKDKEIEDLKEWQEWYSMWHKKFQKQIEELTIELETYRPTKLHGNGQCECYKCKQEGRQSIEWTDWCSRYKGHIYCEDCIKEILKEEQTPQTQLAI